MHCFTSSVYCESNQLFKLSISPRILAILHPAMTEPPIVWTSALTLGWRWHSWTHSIGHRWRARTLAHDAFPQYPLADSGWEGTPHQQQTLQRQHCREPREWAHIPQFHSAQGKLRGPDDSKHSTAEGQYFMICPSVKSLAHSKKGKLLGYDHHVENEDYNGWHYITTLHHLDPWPGLLPKKAAEGQVAKICRGNHQPEPIGRVRWSLKQVADADGWLYIWRA